MVDKKYEDIYDDPVERAKAWLTKDDDERWKAGVRFPFPVSQSPPNSFTLSSLDAQSPLSIYIANKPSRNGCPNFSLI